MQKYKIYLYDKVIHILNKKEPRDKFYENFLITYESELLNINDYLQTVENSSSDALILVDHVAQFIRRLEREMKLIEAAGGIVLTKNDNSLLCIFRKNKWDLPKGKIEKDEHIETAALREVAEECGINSHKIVEHFENTHHIYYLKERWILKKSYWFIMSSEKEVLIPQVEEDITEAEWIAPNSLRSLYVNTYPLIKDLFEKVHEKILR